MTRLLSAAGFCAVSKTLPLPQNVETELITEKVESNGLNAQFGHAVHCVAAEPHATFLRVGVLDEGREVAYETAVLGRLRRGYRVIQLRCTLGTRIELCYLFVKISFGYEPNEWETPRQARQLQLEAPSRACICANGNSRIFAWHQSASLVASRIRFACAVHSLPQLRIQRSKQKAQMNEAVQPHLDKVDELSLQVVKLQRELTEAKGRTRSTSEPSLASRGSEQDTTEGNGEQPPQTSESETPRESGSIRASAASKPTVTML